MQSFGDAKLQFRCQTLQAHRYLARIVRLNGKTAVAHQHPIDDAVVDECDACGARRPVKAVKKAAKVEEAPLVEGKVYELMIQDIGKKGDGIAKLDKYVIYVPGTAKGSIVKVFIEKIAGTVAFGRVTRE